MKERKRGAKPQSRNAAPFGLLYVCVCLCVLDAMPLIVCQTEFVCISQIETVAVHTEVKICHQRTCTQEVRVSDALILSSKTT